MAADSDHVLINNFVSAFYLLESAIGNAVAAYRDAPMPIWTHRPVQAPGEWVASALHDIWYKDGQAGNESTAYVGLVGAAPMHIQRLHEVNHAKHVLHLAGQALKKSSRANFQQAKAALGQGRRAAQPLLNDVGLARLHLKQAWRRLPIADAPVRRVHFSWYTSGRTIKRMTVAEVDEALCRLDTNAAHIQIQRGVLASLPRDEVLAQVKPQTCAMRANLTYFDPLPSLKLHVAMNVGMPLFVPLEASDSLPEHNMPDLDPPAARQWPKRRDAKLEEDVLLPSVHVHRYCV